MSVFGAFPSSLFDERRFVPARFRRSVVANGEYAEILLRQRMRTAARSPERKQASKQYQIQASDGQGK